MPILPLVGDEFASYRLRGIISRGGMSVVYQAENPRLGNFVALKVLTPELATNDVFRTRFLQESRTAAAQSHPNVVPIYDAGSCEDLLYIAMRYVSGPDRNRRGIPAAPRTDGHRGARTGAREDDGVGLGLTNCVNRYGPRPWRPN